MTAGSTRPVEELIATVARARWRALLRVYHARLGREDLEDCLAQATLELVVQARRGALTTRDTALIGGALEHKFKSRITDRRRAISGRSAIATAEHRATQIDAITDLLPTRHDTQALVIARDELHQLARGLEHLTPDQRLVITHHLNHDATSTHDQFCAQHAWTPEKYRKTLQRARARLIALTAQAGATTGAERR